MNMPRRPNPKKSVRKYQVIPYRVDLNDMGKDNMSRYHAVTGLTLHR
jgi:hypothetical protein